MLVVLKCVVISRWFVVLNFPPLKMSRTSMCSLIMLHVNLRVLCALLSLSKKLSSSLLVPCLDVIYVMLPDKR